MFFFFFFFFFFNYLKSKKLKNYEDYCGNYAVYMMADGSNVEKLGMYINYI